MLKRSPIQDHYGMEITVEPLMGSIGPCVDLEFGKDINNLDGFFRLTPEQARELGEWLIEASEARG